MLYLPATQFMHVAEDVAPTLELYFPAAQLQHMVGRVRHSVAIYGQFLLFCDQSMREKAWRIRKRRTLLAGAAGELAGATRARLARLFECMHIL